MLFLFGLLHTIIHFAIFVLSEEFIKRIVFDLAIYPIIEIIEGILFEFLFFFNKNYYK